MLEISVLSVGFIKNDLIFRGGEQSQYFFLENFMEDWISIATLFIEDISDVRWVSSCFIVNCDISRKNMFRIIWRYYFFNSFPHSV